jgi:hypothetical protein
MSFALTNFESSPARSPAEDYVLFGGPFMLYLVGTRWDRSSQWEERRRMMRLQDFASPTTRRNDLRSIASVTPFFAYPMN